MSLKIEATQLNKSTDVTLLNEGVKSVRHATNFTLECIGKNNEEGGEIKIRIGGHFLKIDLKPGSKIDLKDYGTKIEATQ